MKLVFSINKKKEVINRNNIQPFNLITIGEPKQIPKITNVLGYNMFARIQNVSNCTSCGK